MYRIRGNYDGDEVAQVYIFSSLIKERFLPLKQLKGFKRVHISKGQETEITVRIPKKELRLWSENNSEFSHLKEIIYFLVGASSEDIRLQQVVPIRYVNALDTELLEGVRIFSRDHRIVVIAENPVRLDIYNVDGKLVHSGKIFLEGMKFPYRQVIMS